MHRSANHSASALNLYVKSCKFNAESVAIASGLLCGAAKFRQLLFSSPKDQPVTPVSSIDERIGKVFNGMMLGS